MVVAPFRKKAMFHGPRINVIFSYFSSYYCQVIVYEITFIKLKLVTYAYLYFLLNAVNLIFLLCSLIITINQ